MMPVALGFRVKSGYAIAVALCGPASAPAAVARRDRRAERRCRRGHATALPPRLLHARGRRAHDRAARQDHRARREAVGRRAVEGRAPRRLPPRRTGRRQRHRSGDGRQSPHPCPRERRAALSQGARIGAAVARRRVRGDRRQAARRDRPRRASNAATPRSRKCSPDSASRSAARGGPTRRPHRSPHGSRSRHDLTRQGACRLTPIYTDAFSSDRWQRVHRAACRAGSGSARPRRRCFPPRHDIHRQSHCR